MPIYFSILQTGFGEEYNENIKVYSINFYCINDIKAIFQ